MSTVERFMKLFDIITDKEKKNFLALKRAGEHLEAKKLLGLLRKKYGV